MAAEWQDDWGDVAQEMSRRVAEKLKEAEQKRDTKSPNLPDGWTVDDKRIVRNEAGGVVGVWGYDDTGTVEIPDGWSVDVVHDEHGKPVGVVVPPVEASAAQKHDFGKSRLDLIEPEFLIDMGRVLGYGADKYSPENWRQGLSTDRLYAALQRHLNAYWGGEDLDPESGLSHLAHAACSLMFLSWTAEHKPELDARLAKEKRS